MLLLLLTSTNKLLAKWQGPYTVVRKMGPVTYEIHHPDKRKSHQTYHVNLLKEWKETPNKTPERSLMLRKVDDEEEDEPAPEVRPQRHPAKVNLIHLNDPLRAEMQDLLDRFPLLFRKRPGRTELVQHSIHLTDTAPSRQRPYVSERLLKCLKEEIEMMKQLKERMCSSPVLQSPNFDQRFLVQVDASEKGIGAVLAQGTAGEEKPVVFLSRKLLHRETRYSTIEKECLAIKWSLESLRYYLLGREFDLETDHQTLTWIHTMKDHNARITRWYDIGLGGLTWLPTTCPGTRTVSGLERGEVM